MDGYCDIGLFAFMLLVVILVFVFGLDCGEWQSWAYIWIVVFVGIFKFVWTIVGSVMFWGELNANGLCGDSVKGYMYARLILGFLGYIVMPFVPMCVLFMGLSPRVFA